MNTVRKYKAEQAEQLQAWVDNRQRERRMQLTPYSEDDEIMKILTTAMTAIGVFAFMLLFFIVMAMLIHWVNVWAASSVVFMTLTLWFGGKYRGWW